MKNVLSLKKRVFSVCVLLAFLFPFAAACGKPPVAAEKTTVRIAATDYQREYLRATEEAFNAQSEDYRLEFVICPSREVRNYYLSHGALNADIVLFDNLYAVNVNSDYLLDIRRFEGIVEYRASILDYMRKDDGSLYALPAPGELFCNAYNADLLGENNVALPRTLNDVILLSQRLNRQSVTGSVISSATGGDDSVFNALLSVVYPSFLFSPRGHVFIKDYLLGKTRMGDEAYRKDWQAVFDYFSSLYSNRFYSLDSTEKTDRQEISRFLSGSTYAMQVAPSVDAKELLSGSTVLAPYLGINELSRCVGSKPRYFVSLTAEVADSEKKLAGAKSFLSFLSSDEGQRLNGVNGEADGKISYLKGQKSYGKDLDGIRDCLDQGRIFVCDYFYVMFEKNVDLLKKFLTDALSVDQLIDSLDEAMEKSFVSPKYYEAEKDFDFDPEKVVREETAIGNFFVDCVRRAADTEVCLLPSSAILGNILKGPFTEVQLCGLLADGNYTFVSVRAGGLADRIRRSTELLLLSGASTDASGRLCRNGVPFDDEKVVYALIPEDIAEDLSGWIVRKGSSRTLYSLVGEFGLGDTVSPPGKDGRYGRLPA